VTVAFHAWVTRCPDRERPGQPPAVDRIAEVRHGDIGGEAAGPLAADGVFHLAARGCGTGVGRGPQTEGGQDGYDTGE
jgi:hypothetical protein